MSSTNYSYYAVPNSVLIKQLNLVRHTEGGASNHPSGWLRFKWTSSCFCRILRRDRPPERASSVTFRRSGTALSNNCSIIDLKFLIDDALRPLATSIYYLLTPDEPDGVFHMNKSAVSQRSHDVPSRLMKRNTDYARPSPRPR